MKALIAVVSLVLLAGCSYVVGQEASLVAGPQDNFAGAPLDFGIQSPSGDGQE